MMIPDSKNRLEKSIHDLHLLLVRCRCMQTDDANDAYDDADADDYDDDDGDNDDINNNASLNSDHNSILFH